MLTIYSPHISEVLPLSLTMAITMHDLRHNILRLPMTKREYFVQCTRSQFLKLIRETPLVELNRNGYTTIVQFSGHFKYTIINQYDPICTINNCHICGLP